MDSSDRYVVLLSTYLHDSISGMGAPCMDMSDLLKIYR